MIFVDSNVWMYAVGRPHPLREVAQRFFEESLESRTPLVVSAEVLQELLHAYLPVNRTRTLDSALTLIESLAADIWDVTAEDVRLARLLMSRYSGLGARDLLHLACCRRRDVTRARTFDRGLAAAFDQ